MTTGKPRGIRNNNPGNIEYSAATKWQGLDNPPVEPEGRFARFKDAVYGIRAIARLIITYGDKYDCDTVRKIISRWAPSHENNTSAYVRAICAAVGVTPDETINVHEYAILRPMVEAIIKHENGQQPYSAAQIDKALVLAGVEPEKKPLAKSRTVKSAAVVTATGGAAIAAGVAEQVANVAPAVPVVQGVAETAQNHPTGLLIVFGAIVIAFALYIMWARFDDRRKGLR